MAHAPMPKIVSIHNSSIGCNQSMSALTEVLQSESVQRLFNRQNVFLQNSDSSDFSLHKKSQDRTSGVTIQIRPEKKPELSVIPVMSFLENGNTTTSSEDDRHLLPSKHEGKSSVALLPISRERKPCGHLEHCENIVCEIKFQQLKDGANVYPLIAVNIESNEIDAPVSKHCKSELCDALSIDHDRCRRAIIRCHRCDQTNTCDICLVVLKTRKSQMNHKNCKMRIVYRHNRASRGQIMKDRMRMRELQILEAARVNKNDYTDPVNGHDRAMESLQNNSELIIIPKAALPVQQHPTIRITSVTGAAMSPNVAFGDMYGKLLPRMPLVFPQQGVLGKRASLENSDIVLAKQTKIGDTTVSAAPSSSSLSLNNPFITITAMPTKNFVQPATVNNFLQKQPRTTSANQTQSNPYLMPNIRMVPIASLKTEPSLMHHTQGVPKFCLVADNPAEASSNFGKTPKRILPAQPLRNIDKSGSNDVDKNPMKNDARTEALLKKFKTGMRRGRRKKLISKRSSKAYECSFCFKKFSTDWYFKLHIAKHKGEIKFTCKYCKKPFMHLYNMTKHVVTMHKKDSNGESATAEETDVNIEEDKKSLNCASCNSLFESKIELEKHPCRIVCLLCHVRVLHGDLLLHLKAKHSMSDEKAVDEYDRQKQQRSIRRIRMRNKRSLENSELRRSRVKEEIEEEGDEESGLTKRRRNLLNETRRRSDETNDRSQTRRLTRRRNNSLTDQLETNLLADTIETDLPNPMESYVETLLMSPSSPDADPLETHASR